MEWRDVIGFEGRYQVSDCGFVRSTVKRGRNLFLKLHLGGTAPYRFVALWSADGKRSSHTVHRLVLAAFVGPCPDGFEGRHLDGNRENNHAWNLRWSTHAENEADKIAHGTRNRGSAHGQALWEEAQVIAARDLRAAGWRVVDIAKKFSVPAPTVSAAIRRVSWKHI